MKKLVRFGVSLDHHLLDDFDRHIADKNYTNRSEAIRDLIRDTLVAREWSDDRETVGAITIVYDHHVHDLADRLTHLQHRFHRLVLSTMHLHLDERHCLEVLAVRGRGRHLRKLADTLIGTKGVKHGKLTTTTTGRRLS
jgi:CopG family nickel-responsive transcriptional regulator